MTAAWEAVARDPWRRLLVHATVGLGAPTFCGAKGRASYAAADVTCPDCLALVPEHEAASHG